MVVSSTYLLCLILCFCFNLCAQEKLDLYEQAANCPYRYQMGCMLDVVEKSCHGYEFIEACAKRGQCENLREELGGFISALDLQASEAYHKCCCRKAFEQGGYESCKNPNQVCLKAFADHVDPYVAKYVQILRKCYDNPGETTCKDAIDGSMAMNVAFQKARSVLWPTEGCKMLAAPDPMSPCGWDIKPEPRPIERTDLYCDTIIWQFKEMGFVDSFLSQCKDAPIIPQKHRSGKMDGEL